MAEGVRINDVRWGLFIAKLKAAGCVIAHTSADPSHLYVKRVLDGVILSAPLPRDFDPDDPDKSGAVGVFVFESFCRKLEINPRTHFKGWYMVL